MIFLNIRRAHVLVEILIRFLRHDTAVHRIKVRPHLLLRDLRVRVDLEVPEQPACALTVRKFLRITPLPQKVVCRIKCSGNSPFTYCHDLKEPQRFVKLSGDSSNK